MLEKRSARIRLDDVSKSFGARQVLHGLHLEFRPSEFIAIVGRSGSGKSTLLRLLCGLEQPSTGSLSIADERGSDRRHDVRVVFQEPRLLPWKSVLANVTLGRSNVDLRTAREVLAHVGLADRANDYPGVLSGGQRQRVALARALVHQPSVLLLDEPFGALDALTRIEAQGLVESLWRRAGFTAVLVTHDVEEAVLLADRVLVVEEGAIVDEVFVDLSRPRTRELAEVGRLTSQLLDRVMGRARKSFTAGPAQSELTHDAIGGRMLAHAQ